MTLWSDIVRSLARGFRLLLFMPVPRYAADPSRAAVVALTVLAILAGALLEASLGGDDLRFSGLGLAAALGGWCVYALLLWLSKPASARFGLPTILADACTLSTMTALAMAALLGQSEALDALWSWSTMAGFGLLVTWWALALWRAGRLAFTGSDWCFGFRATQYAVIVALLMPDMPIVEGRDTQRGFDVWQIARGYWNFYTTDFAGGEEEASPRRRVDVEATYYRQPLLVRSALEAISHSDPKRSEIYLLAAAGYAEQDVFRSEVEKTRDLFDARFGTSGRSVIAMNHADTVDTVPLANATNLEALLQGMAQKMDKDDDVLVLFLTSHGMKGRFSVNFSGFSLNDLTPERLRTMLDKAGIKHRVLVISACYSGSFISALSDPHTLVMTAASDSRSSFGCSNEREWTFFGDALFNRALRETFSFEAAFAKARETVAAWEREQKATPSDPQMSSGAAIHAKLKGLAAEFAAAERARKSPAANERSPVPAQPAAAEVRADAR